MTMKMFVPITKVDEAKRLVYGRAVQEVVDRVGEIFDYASSKPHFEEWSKSFSDATDGKSLGNIRAMHGKVAAGKVAQIDFHDTDKAIDIAAKIVDEAEWGKVLEGVYTGFSIGGSYVGDRITEKIDDQEVKRYTAKPSEISIVDSPCIPTAKFFEVVKADGAVEKVAFKPASPAEVRGTPEQLAEFEQMLTKADGYGMRELLDILGVESMLDTAEGIEKREFSADERKSAAKEGAALPDGSFPIKTKGDLANAIKAYGRAKDKAAAKAHIIKRAKALGASDMLPKDWTEKLNESGEVKKGLWNVGRFAECLECVASIAGEAEFEAAYEGDDSPVPMQLRNWLGDGIEIFKGMTDEESTELLAALKESAGVGEDDEIEMAIENAMRIGILRKTLTDPATTVDAVAKIAKEYDEPLTTAVMADMPALVERIVAKAKMTQANMDRLQAAHDHLASMGASCGKQAAAPADEIVKAIPVPSDREKELEARIKKLEAQPMPHVITLRAVQKGNENGKPVDWVTKVPFERLIKIGNQIDWAASEKDPALVQEFGAGA